MTSIRQVNPWTPELIQKDKALKEKYGKNAHIIPARVDSGVKSDQFIANKQINKPKEKKNLAKKLLIGAAAIGWAVVH